MKHTTWTYLFPFANLPILVNEFAFKYANDIRKVVPQIEIGWGQDKLSMATARDLFYYLQNRYVLEEEEQFLRPKYFAMIGGDCDDQMIFALAFYKFFRLSNEKVFIHESGQTSDLMTHIYCSVDLLEGKAIFDALPENEFGNVTGKYIKTYPLVDFL